MVFTSPPLDWARNRARRGVSFHSRQKGVAAAGGGAAFAARLAATLVLAACSLLPSAVSAAPLQCDGPLSTAAVTQADPDYVDLLQIHRLDPAVSVEETMEALHDVVKAGKARYIGASSMWAWQFSTTTRLVIAECGSLASWIASSTASSGISPSGVSAIGRRPAPTTTA